MFLRERKGREILFIKASIYIEILSSRCWNTINARGKQGIRKDFVFATINILDKVGQKKRESKDHKIQTISSCNEGFGAREVSYRGVIC